jgi:septal ring factor EnvC (AmiA/AmiB activator)
MADKGENHSRRTASHQRNEPSESNLFFSFLSPDSDCNLAIHPSLISALTCCQRTSSAPKKSQNIRSDSSTKEEDATHEQRTTHQLRRCIRHLEHDLRDITARCCAERECRMSLEALVGGKIFNLI